MIKISRISKTINYKNDVTKKSIVFAIFSNVYKFTMLRDIRSNVKGPYLIVRFVSSTCDNSAKNRRKKLASNIQLSQCHLNVTTIT